jgi:peptide deformylase
MSRKEASAERIQILLLGDPGLRVSCAAVEDFDAPDFRSHGKRLIRALEQFRAEYGFGRAISAPQIGIRLRMIAMNLGEGPFLIVNPEITRRSDERFILWDDCMSFPWLMVRLERNFQVDLAFRDDRGTAQAWPKVNQAVSELLQHEIDHLDGVLAVDRAIDRDSIIARKLYEERREFFDRQVDYSIVPTIPAR